MLIAVDGSAPSASLCCKAQEGTTRPSILTKAAGKRRQDASMPSCVLLYWLCYFALIYSAQAASVNGSDHIDVDSGSGYKVFRFIPTSTKDLEFLKTLRLDAPKYKVDTSCSG
ncbi:hypothetical protein D918_07348 [Trichuris suis]|nr:hypothetical protein D918_07348 [Trichuris suis]